MPRQHRRHFEYTEHTVNVGERFYLKDELEKLLWPFFTMYADKSQIYVCDQDVFHCDISRHFKFNMLKLSLSSYCSPVLSSFGITPSINPNFSSLLPIIPRLLTQVLISWRADNRKATFSNFLLFLESLFQTSSRLLQIFRRKQTSELLHKLQRQCVLPMTYWVFLKHS